MVNNHKPLTIVVSEIDLKNGCKHLRYIRFPLDNGKYPICYRSRTSYGAFIHVNKGRNYCPNPKRAQLLYLCDHEDMRTLVEPNVAIIDVQNLWEFYKLIGYNHRTKRYE